jgi:hypothetical protein
MSWDQLLEIQREARERRLEEVSRPPVAADEEVSDQQLAEVLRRLTDCGQVVQVRRFDAAPMAYVTAGGWDFDVVDNLEADICQALRGRSEIGYEDDEHLKGLLRDAGVEGFSDRELGQAIGHLVYLGHLQSPRADHWDQKNQARPTWLVEPRIRSG